VVWKDPCELQKNRYAEDPLSYAPQGMTFASSQQIEAAGYAASMRQQYPDDWDYIFAGTKHFRTKAQNKADE
jgi:hypothetical protein